MFVGSGLLPTIPLGDVLTSEDLFENQLEHFQPPPRFSAVGGFDEFTKGIGLNLDTSTENNLLSSDALDCNAQQRDVIYVRDVIFETETQAVLEQQLRFEDLAENGSQEERYEVSDEARKQHTRAMNNLNTKEAGKKLGGLFKF